MPLLFTKLSRVPTRSLFYICDVVDGVFWCSIWSPWGCGGQALVIDSQIGSLILEDLAFPLRHNNALCAALPVSQAREEGTGRLSHSSHRFLSTSLLSPRSQTSDSVVSFRGGKMTAPCASQQDATELYLGASRKGSTQT